MNWTVTKILFLIWFTYLFSQVLDVYAYRAYLDVLSDHSKRIAKIEERIDIRGK